MELKISHKFDAVLADYDGTVLNSMEHLAINATEMYRQEGVEVELEEFICQYIQPFTKLHSHFGLKCETLEEQDLYNKKYWEVSDRNNFRSEMFPGALDALKRLHRNGLVLGIVSAAKKSAIHSRFEEEGVGNLFDGDHIVGESDRKVDAIKAFCVKNNLDPDKVLMIGDVPSDLEYGKQAGVKVAGFVWNGYPEKIFTRLKSRLEQTANDFIFSDWKNLS